jgi:hypothetical protein
VWLWVVAVFSEAGTAPRVYVYEPEGVGVIAVVSGGAVLVIDVFSLAFGVVVDVGDSDR